MSWRGRKLLGSYSCLVVLLIKFWCFTVISAEEGNFDHLIIDSPQQPDQIDQTDAASNAYEARTYTQPCSGLSQCVPLSECSSMFVSIAKSCYSGDRSMFCGGSDDVPHVCCPSSPLERNQVCGKSLVQGQFYRGLGTFPFIARIGFKNVNTGSIAYPCAGSIISRRVILTAAHCALAKADGHRLSSVRVGEYDLSTDPDCATTGFCAPRSINHAISHVVVHPDYKPGQYHHDIALLVLKTPLNYSVACQPICLMTSRTDLVIGKRATIAGWGKVSTSTKRSSEMQYMDIPLTAWDMCLRVYGSTGALDSPNSVDGQWMCAGGEGKDVCQGFGGAPLFIMQDGMYSQIGIMSFGSDNCGGVRIPSVYISIAHFADWIHDNTPIE
ncbi:unnamed protein product [Hermetia illucens]|uniref:Peptidase S1 domain-containing protein n=1 Tax=Hermetia illucens TaxID=343691 RepID=A0A7R8UT91_HERIL|nr:venom protease [Hermetia illucens]CAD7086315.1 unnamed protein product [Hermetia illucens]